MKRDQCHTRNSECVLVSPVIRGRPTYNSEGSGEVLQIWCRLNIYILLQQTYFYSFTPWPEYLICASLKSESITALYHSQMIALLSNLTDHLSMRIYIQNIVGTIWPTKHFGKLSYQVWEFSVKRHSEKWFYKGFSLQYLNKTSKSDISRENWQFNTVKRMWQQIFLPSIQSLMVIFSTKHKDVCIPLKS